MSWDQVIGSDYSNKCIHTHHFVFIIMSGIFGVMGNVNIRGSESLEIQMGSLFLFIDFHKWILEVLVQCTSTVVQENACCFSLFTLSAFKCITSWNIFTAWLRNMTYWCIGNLQIILLVLPALHTYTHTHTEPGNAVHISCIRYKKL